MTKQQRSEIIYTLFKTIDADRVKLIKSLINHFNISSKDTDLVKNEIIEEFNSGVKTLNNNQFENLLKLSFGKDYSETEIKNKLKFYEISLEYHDNIIAFLNNFNQANKPLNVHRIDLNFKGVQVATFDDFNIILNRKWTGDWVLDPKNVNPNKIQIASMNETGSYPRGYYINADIEKFEPVSYGDKTRYRIHFSNPIIVHSGNRNIKFSSNPVRYIK